MADSFNFTRRSAGRIDAAVKWMERQKRQTPHGTSRDEVIIPFLFRRFELKYELTPGGNVEAYLVEWSDTENDYAIKESVTFDVYDFLGKYSGQGHSETEDGARGIAIKAHDCDRWEIVDMDVEELVRRFELKDALTPASTSATAYVCDDAWAESAVEFEVYDPLKRFRGRAKDAMSSPNDKGSQGEARFCPDNGHWEIVWMQPHALVISCLASAANTGTSTISVDTVAVAQPTGALLMAAVTSVVNGHAWTCDDNAKIDAIWDESLATPGWKAIQVDCPA